MDRVRIASLQYFIRPVRTLGEFSAQVDGLVSTAADYKCDVVVFPEYFTTQLLTLGDVRRPIEEQVRDLPGHVPAYVELLGGLAKKHNLYIVGGTILTNGDASRIHNDCFVFGPKGDHAVQGKLHMTRFESEEWKVDPRAELRVIETRFGKVGVTICYDVEFPEVARAFAREGAHVIFAPSCTDDRQAFLRVRYCAHARAIENQIYMVQSSTVGSLPMVPAVSLNYGQAAILTPSDFQFARDGILAEGIPNQETMVIGELNLHTITESRSSGTVIPLHDSLKTNKVIATTKHVTL
jgi:predicted amidohydrolase